MKNWKYIEGAKTGNKNPDWNVGNYDWDVGIFNGQWYITKNGQKFKGPFGSMQAAARYLDGHKWEFEGKLAKSKTGNETLGEYVKSKPRVINEEKTGAEEFFKQLSDDAKKREEKDDEEIEKVGNSLIGKTVWVKKSDGHQYKATVLREDGGRVYVNTGDGDQFWRLKHEIEVINKVGNQSYKFYGEVIDIAKTDTNTLKEILDELRSLHEQGDFQRAIKDELNKRKTGNKVGNAGFDLREPDPSGRLEAEARARLRKAQWKDIYSHFMRATPSDLDKIKTKQDAISFLVKKGENANDPAVIEAVKRFVGNSIGGGVQSETVLTETKDGSQYWIEKTSKSGQYAQYNLYYTIGQGKRHAGVFKDKEAAVDAGRRIIGNSGSDDKFAYVMREFDAGKLKTPDGKVVTDPAQAKAIAYSESKKTENGLARARKAMNAWNSERKIEPVGKYREFIRDLKNAIMLDVSAVTYNNVDESTLKSWVEQAKKEGFGSAIKGVQGKKVILDVY